MMLSMLVTGRRGLRMISSMARPVGVLPITVEDLEEMACPKKKVSVFKRRLRVAGHRAQRGLEHKPYKICKSCGAAVEMHYLCMPSH
ncbi:unnamed protein product (mitochondrion) [Plasmodiophora brassicae]|uniref:50S ribosomal protein L32 n=1 Tax=Plasmodiophora brassicae TaxID=37360 RepID=A0A3P3Y231_PLABS|nr:unnamed protein product [Plasmodiophora brassicae]